MSNLYNQSTIAKKKYLYNHTSATSISQYESIVKRSSWNLIDLQNFSMPPKITLPNRQSIEITSKEIEREREREKKKKKRHKTMERTSVEFFAAER